jgi:DNA-binding MurR/RpiR family transcriptional regulator
MYPERIRAAYNELTPGYRRIADYLINHYREAAFMTAAEVGRAAFVDTTLVVRFAQRLGYPGYPELIAEVQEQVKSDLRAVYMPLEEDQSPSAIVQRTLTEDRNNLEHMRLHLDAQAIEKVVRLLRSAHRIYVTGEGNTWYIAEAFVVRLTMMGRAAYTIPAEPVGQAAVVAALKPGDVVVGLAMTNLTPSMATLLSMACAAGAGSVGIVGSPTNRAGSAAEIVLHAPTSTYGIFPSMTAFAALLHGIVQAVAVDLDPPTEEWAARTGNYLHRYATAMRTEASSLHKTVQEYTAKAPQA